MPRSMTGDVGIVAAVFLAAAAAVGLLTWSAVSANGIDDKAAAIADTARGIHRDTSSIIRLGHTNALAAQVLAGARPLAPELGTALQSARSIDSQVRSIRQSAGGISVSARRINDSAISISSSAQSILSSGRGINERAADILRIAEVIREDVALINLSLAQTITLAHEIHDDTANIASRADTARHLAACIDREVHGPASARGGC